MIEIDFSLLWQFFYEVGSQGPLMAVWIVFYKYYGWIPFIIFLIKGPIWHEYIEHIQAHWYHTQKFILLAIDVPRNNETSVQAMEEFFVHMLGAHGTLTKWEQYIEGKFQLSMSLELVSIEGNIQYLIRCPVGWRDLVESGIYAQFPDAEITEVEDYTKAVPQVWPNETHDLWGVEYSLDGGNWYPIKTYRLFEDPLTQTYIDPMAALLESMSRAGPGEQMWLQIYITPMGVDWSKDAAHEVEKIKGKYKPHPSMIQQMLGAAGAEAGFVLGEVGKLVGVGAAGAEHAEEKAINPLLTMTPGERDRLRALEEKISKLAFGVKMRYLYVARKENMNKSRGVNPIIGAIKQWNRIGINGFKPELKKTGTRANYLFVEQRLAYKKKISFKGYVKRSAQIGLSKFKLNVEELASLWHFPTMFVRTPTVSMAKIKKTEAPVSLPFEVQKAGAEEKKAKAPTPPAGELAPLTVDLDDDSFERTFAKDKKLFEQTSAARKERLAEEVKRSPRPQPAVMPAQPVTQPIIEESAVLPEDEDRTPPPATPSSTAPMRAPDNLPF